MIAETVRSLAEGWSVWALGALADGAVALVAAGVLWLLFRKWIPARWGMWLFLLVMAKSLIPTPVAMPGRDWLRGAVSVVPAVAPTEVELPSPEMDRLPVGMAVAGKVSPALGAREILFLLWSSGVAAGFVLLGLRGWRTWRLVRDARALEVSQLERDPDWAARLELGEISLRESDLLSSPAAWGGRSPSVILPEGLAGKLSVPQLRWTLAHEISHLRNGDWAVALAQAVCGLLCFFNPAVWLASIAASALRERACDEAAVRMTGIPPKESASGFLHLVEWSRSRDAFRGAVMPGLSLEGRTARWRMRRLLGGLTPARQSSVMMAAVLLAVLLLLPSFRGGFAADVQARGEIVRLEAKVADLEGRLERKSAREERAELNQRRASERVAMDAATYTHEQRNAIETIYQEARRKLTTAEKEQAYAKLAAEYPRSNRTGCAMLFSARAATGAVREARLRGVISKWSDCFYLDGTSVGGVARLALAQDLLQAGRQAEAAALLDELEKDFTGHLDHEGNPLEGRAGGLRAAL